MKTRKMSASSGWRRDGNFHCYAGEGRDLVPWRGYCYGEIG